MLLFELSTKRRRYEVEIYTKQETVINLIYYKTCLYKYFSEKNMNQQLSKEAVEEKFNLASLTRSKSSINSGEKEKTMKPFVSAKKILLQLPIETYNKILSLVKLTGVTNKTRIIISSIDLAFEVVKHIKAGGQVFLEDEKGKKMVTLIGL